MTDLDDPGAIDPDKIRREAGMLTPLEELLLTGIEALRIKNKKLGEAIASQIGQELIDENEALRAREVELVGALEDAAQFMENLRGPDPITHTSHIHAAKVRAALATTPTQVTERARAAEKVAGYARHTQYCDLVRCETSRKSGPPQEIGCTCGLKEALRALGKLSSSPHSTI